MNIQFTGKIIEVLPLRSGTSQRGNQWESQQYVIEEQNERYPARCCFQVFGHDKISEFNIQKGEVIPASLGLGARENEKGWFNSIDCWKVDRANPSQAIYNEVKQQAAPQQTQQAAPQPVQNDLPF